MANGAFNNGAFNNGAFNNGPLSKLYAPYPPTTPEFPVIPAVPPTPGEPPFIPGMPPPIDKGWVPPGPQTTPVIPQAFSLDISPGPEGMPGALGAPQMSPGGQNLNDAPPEVRTIISQLMGGLISDAAARQQIASFYTAQGGVGPPLATYWLGPTPVVIPTPTSLPTGLPTGDFMPGAAGYAPVISPPVTPTALPGMPLDLGSMGAAAGAPAPVMPTAPTGMPIDLGSMGAFAGAPAPVTPTAEVSPEILALDPTAGYYDGGLGDTDVTPGYPQVGLARDPSPKERKESEEARATLDDLLRRLDPQMTPTFGASLYRDPDDAIGTVYPGQEPGGEVPPTPPTFGASLYRDPDSIDSTNIEVTINFLGDEVGDKKYVEDQIPDATTEDDVTIEAFNKAWQDIFKKPAEGERHFLDPAALRTEESAPPIIGYDEDGMAIFGAPGRQMTARSELLVKAWAQAEEMRATKDAERLAQERITEQKTSSEMSEVLRATEAENQWNQIKNNRDIARDNLSLARKQLSTQTELAREEQTAESEQASVAAFLAFNRAQQDFRVAKSRATQATNELSLQRELGREANIITRTALGQERELARGQLAQQREAAEQESRLGALQAFTNMFQSILQNPYSFGALNALGGLPAFGFGGQAGAGPFGALQGISGQPTPSPFLEQLAPIGYQVPEYPGLAPAIREQFVGGAVPTLGSLSKLPSDAFQFLQRMLGLTGIGPAELGRQAAAVTPGGAGYMPGAAGFSPQPSGFALAASPRGRSIR